VYDERLGAGWRAAGGWPVRCKQDGARRRGGRCEMGGKAIRVGDLGSQIKIIPGASVGE
jgi:hypothetical protein